MRLPNASRMFASLQANILLVDYRGYGHSTGTPREARLKDDAVACIDKLRKDSRIDPHQIGAFGRSLGGAVAISLAATRPEHVAFVVVENTFTSIGDMVDVVMPVVAPFKAILLRIGWDSLALAQQIKQPILFLSGLRDELVPPAQMQRLHDAMTASVLRRLYTVRNGHHNDTHEVGGKGYYNALRVFLADAMSARSGLVAAAAAGQDAAAAEADVGIDGPAGSSIPMMPRTFHFGRGNPRKKE